MKAESIVNQVLADAQASAEQTIAGARKKAAEIQQASEARIEEGAKATRSRAQKDGAAQRDRMLRMAGLEDRKRDLAHRRELLDQLFSTVTAKMEQDSEQMRSVLQALAVKHAIGTETLLVGERHGEWFDEQFVTELNDRLKRAGKPCGITVSGEKAEGICGMILRDGDADLAITCEEIVNSLRPALEGDMDEALFGPKGALK